MDASVPAAEKNNNRKAGRHRGKPFWPRTVVADLVLGAFNGIDSVLWGYTFASLIFTGILAPYLPVAVLATLLGTIAVALVVAFTSKLSINIAGPEEQAVAILATVAVMANAETARFVSVDAAAATIFAIIVLSSLALGAAYLLAARFNLGLLIQLMPYPVVCGFLAGTGWLFVSAGISMMTGVTIDIFNPAPLFTLDALLHWLPALAIGAAIYVLLAVKQHSLVLPLSLAACAGGFFAVAFWLDIPLEALRAQGWLFDLDHAAGARSLATLDVANIEWGFVAGALPEIGAIVLIALLVSSFSFSALELGLGRPVTLNHEFVSHGLANLASAPMLGLPGTSEVPSTLFAYRLGGGSRLLPVTMCVFLLAAALAGQEFLRYMPKLVIGAVVFLAAVQFLHEYLLRASRQMNRADMVCVWTIFGVIVLADFILGVLVGIALTSLVFIIRYSKIGILASSYTLNEVASSVERAPAEQKVLHDTGDHARLFNLRGYLFFGTANIFFEQMKGVCARSRAGSYFIFSFRRVNGIDSTAAKVFVKLINMLRGEAITPVFCALGEETARSFALAGIPTRTRCEIFRDVESALKWVEEQLLREREDDARGATAAEMLATILGDRDKAEKLASVMERVELKSGGWLFHQGDPEDGAYLIESGTIEVLLKTDTGDTIHLREFRDGSFVGEMAAYSETRQRSASAMAVEPTVLYRMQFSRLRELYGVELEAVMHELVARLLAARLGFMNERLAADL